MISLHLRLVYTEMCLSAKLYFKIVSFSQLALIGTKIIATAFSSLLFYYNYSRNLNNSYSMYIIYVRVINLI